MNYKVLKKVILIMFFFYIIFSLFYNVKAITIGEMESDINNFMSIGEQEVQNANIDYGQVTSEFKDLAQILTMIGTGVMVGVATYMGIKYLTAGPEAQAKLKTQLVGVLVAGLVVFASYPIWKFVIEIVSKF